MSWLMSIGKWRWLCSLVLRAFAECEVTRFRMQCAEVSAFVDQPTRCNMLNYGGANIVLDCETQGRDSTVVFRFSPLSSNSDRSSWHLVSTDDLRAQIAETEDAWLFAVMFKFGLQAVSDSGGHIRRLVRRTEFEGEAQWRDKFQWNPLVFPPAMPSATCTVCMPLQAPIHVFDGSGHVSGHVSDGLQVGITVMARVTGSAGNMLKFLSQTDLLVLLLGYYCDLRRMIGHGHLHDAHSGNILVVMDEATGEYSFRWHEFGESFQVTQPPARLAELSKHVEDFFDLVVDAVRVYDNILATNLIKKKSRCAFEKVRDAQGCLQMQAYDLAHVVLTSSSLDSSQIDNVWGKICHGFLREDAERLHAERLISMREAALQSGPMMCSVYRGDA